jgi:arabinoxylan arabinofuranohydrolase
MYDDFKNIKTNTKINTLGNDASENMYVKMKAGAWTLVRNADFGEDGAKSFMLRAKGTGKLEIRFTKTSEAVATMEFSSTDWEDHVIDIDPEVFNGKRNVFFIFTEAEKVLFDAWAFSKDTATGITPITPAKGQPRGLFDLNGHRLTDGTPYRGVVIEQYQDENGKMRSRKRVSTDAVH